MEKIPEYLSKDFRGTRLFRDHIETIYKLFVENFTKINIYAGKFKYDNIEELLNNENGRIYTFKIDGFRDKNGGGLTGILSLSITGSDTKLTIFDKDDLKSMGLFKIVEDIIIKTSWFRGHLTVLEIIFTIIVTATSIYL